MDFNLVNIEYIPCISEIIWRLTSLGREEMPYAAWIDEFNYNPHVNHSEAAPKGAKAREVSTEDAEASLAVQDPNPPIDPQGETR